MDRCVTMDGVQARLLALVAIGGAVGSVARYAVAGVVTRGDFPWGTFTVNLVGSFSLGLLFFLFLQTGYSSPELRTVLFIGFFGGFTTMSAFSLETVSLLVEAQWALATANVFLNTGLCVFGALLGRAAGLALGGA